MTRRKERRDKIKSHTADIIAVFNTNEILASANYAITKLINEERVIDMTDISDDLELKIVTALDYYEFMCEMLFLAKILDKKTLLQLRGRLMCKTYKVCELYIKQTREKQGRKTYESFEKFVCIYEQRLAVKC